MRRTRIGRQIYALGGNPEAASRIGINILGVQLFVYGYLGFLAGIAGFVQAHRVHQAVPTAMIGQELNVLAVAILGGATLAGGVGSMGGVVLGVLLLAMLQNGLNLLGVSSYFFGVVIGLAILVSTSMTGYAEKRMPAPLPPRSISSSRRSAARPAMSVDCFFCWWRWSGFFPSCCHRHSRDRPHSRR
jgi:simple sugar transport system permease protein